MIAGAADPEKSPGFPVPSNLATTPASGGMSGLVPAFAPEAALSAYAVADRNLALDSVAGNGAQALP